VVQRVIISLNMKFKYYNTECHCFKGGIEKFNHFLLDEMILAKGNFHITITIRFTINNTISPQARVKPIRWRVLRTIGGRNSAVLLRGAWMKFLKRSKTMRIHALGFWCAAPICRSTMKPATICFGKMGRRGEVS
jgi:hypothetical protein